MKSRFWPLSAALLTAMVAGLFGASSFLIIGLTLTVYMWLFTLADPQTDVTIKKIIVGGGFAYGLLMGFLLGLQPPAALSPVVPYLNNAMTGLLIGSMTVLFGMASMLGASFLDVKGRLDAFRLGQQEIASMIMMGGARLAKMLVIVTIVTLPLDTPLAQAHPYVAAMWIGFLGMSLIGLYRQNRREGVEMSV